MADVGAIPFINFGESQAKQAQAGAAANLENQQAAAAAMQNQIMAAKLPVMLDAYREAQDHITDHSGQHNGEDIPAAQFDASSDNSGTAPPGSNANVRVSPYDMIGRDGTLTNRVQGAIQGKYQIDTNGTPQEQAAIMAAFNWQKRADMIDPMLGKSAEDQLNQAKYQKDMAVKERQYQAGLDASKHYEALQNVSTAPHPWQQLYQVDKGAAMRLKATNPNASEDDLDQLAKSAADQAGAFIHRFTGRETIKGDDGIYRDKDTQQPVAGVVPAGFKPEDIEKIREKGNDKDTRMVNGREQTQENFRWAGFDNVDQYVNAAIAKGRAIQASQNSIEQRRQHAVTIQAHAGIPADQRIPPPGSKPGSVVQSIDAANTPAAQGAAAQHQFTKPPGTPPPPPTVVPPPKSPTAAKGDNLPPSVNSPTGKLDMGDIQKTNTPNTPGVMADPRSTASDADKEYWKKLQARNSEAGSTAGGANTAIQIATSAKNALASGAATGNSAALRQMVMTALNNPVALEGILGDATSSAILRKMLGNASFKQIEDDANGNAMRLGSNTIRIAMTQLSASPEMTPEAINALMDQVIKNSRYEAQKNGPDYGRYRASGGDVTDFDRWYDSKYPNKNVINTGDEEYPTPEAVRDAYRSKKITRERATQILQSNHGMTK